MWRVACPEAPPAGDEQKQHGLCGPPAASVLARTTTVRVLLHCRAREGSRGGGGRENTKPECSSEKTYIQCHTVKRRELGKFRIKSQLQTNYNLKTYFTEAKGKNMFKDTIKINHLPKGTEICGMRSYMTTVTLQK